MSLLGETIIKAAEPLARLVIDIIEGRVRNPGDVARSLLGTALDLVPPEEHEELRHYLDDEARRRQDTRFEASKDAKFGPET